MGKRILVVEDNPDNMKLVTWILEDEGFEVTPAYSGEDCLSLAEAQEFDLVLMDISLPGIDGKEATQRLRMNPAYRDKPIIALTAHAIKGEDEEIMQSGVNELITKPLDEEKLVERLHSFLA
ncbi:MAG: response regulator [Ketobacteraceae bacterium]|nr:response regulator [Ketobacteraceae bacterium]